MRNARITTLFVSLIVLFVVASPVLAYNPVIPIPIGQTDDFEDGTPMGWGGGTHDPNDIRTTQTNIPTGGPNGVGDSYMELATINGHLGTNNRVQWGGNRGSTETHWPTWRPTTLLHCWLT